MEQTVISCFAGWRCFWCSALVFGLSGKLCVGVNVSLDGTTLAARSDTEDVLFKVGSKVRLDRTSIAELIEMLEVSIG